MATTAATMTAEQLLAMPEDGTERDLIRGALRERPMTRRSRRHARAEGRIAAILIDWLDQQPAPAGEILDGEAGFRLRRDPDTYVGIDVAYISAEMAAATPEEVAFVDGAPVLAVEVLSPSDRIDEIAEKVNEYLAAGVAQVWLVDPIFRTVTVHRPQHEPVFFNADQELVGDPELPGFRARVRDLIRRG